MRLACCDHSSKDPCGCFLKWWYPQNTPKWSFLVGKPMVVGYHHFRKPPCDFHWNSRNQVEDVYCQSCTAGSFKNVDLQAAPFAQLLCFSFSSTWVLLKWFLVLLSKGSLKLFFLWINQSTKTPRVISCSLVICQWSKCLPSDNLPTLRYLLSKRPGKSKIVKVKPFFRR